jgi:hypothetical protein
MNHSLIAISNPVNIPAGVLHLPLIIFFGTALSQLEKRLFFLLPPFFDAPLESQTRAPDGAKPTGVKGARRNWFLLKSEGNELTLLVGIVKTLMVNSKIQGIFDLLIGMAFSP